MSATAPSSILEHPTTSPRERRVPGWLKEPLLHFVILGGVLFVADHLLFLKRGDAHTIVVGKDVDGEQREMFKISRGRDPDERELEAMHRVYIDNEVLYREGLAMQVDRGDQAIRDRVIFKALSVIDANIKLPPIDDTGLKNWFEQHRGKYDEPARFTFDEAVLAGDNAEEAIRSFVAALNGGTPGDAKAGLRVFKGRPLENLIQSYGAEFPKQLENSPSSEWRAFQTRSGWRAMRAVEMTPAKPATFETVRNAVYADWKDTTAADMRTAAVRTLGRKYQILYESGGQPE